MNRQNRWKVILTALVVAFSLYEMYPPTSRNLIDYFEENAKVRDAGFSNIVARARSLQKTRPHNSYDNLLDAVGNTNLARYFPQFPVKDEPRTNAVILSALQRGAAGKIRLGLDLQGGTSILVRMDTSSLTNEADTSMALEHAVEVLRKRVDKFGVAEPVIQPQGSDHILVQLPGVSAADQQKAEDAIRRAAFLEFKMVHEQSAQFLEEGGSAPGYELMTTTRTQPNGKKTVERYLVKKRAEMVGGIKSAGITRDNIGRPQIMFTLDSKGTETFGRITRENVGRQLAIILDGELQTAPVIRSPIEGGNGVIEGDYSVQEARTLQTVLENPLKAPLKIEASQLVDPTLGRDSIQTGIRATLYGLIGIVAFVMLFYFFSGLIANFALCLNLVITMGIMCAIPATLTLPGIAGLVLSVGMAVDANVLIFERLREELAAGKSLRGAVAAGYSRAFGTILDSNLTTLIASAVLIVMGTGPIKGFGVTLTIGVLVSLFTALVVTRVIFDYLLDNNWMKSLRMLPIVKLTKVDFIGWTKPAFVLSLVVILGGLGYGIFGRGHHMLGVDFAGGDSLTMSFSQRVDVDKLRDVVSKLGVGEPTIQYQKPMAGGRETLVVTAAFGSADKVEKALQSAYPQSNFSRIGVDQVGPTVGSEIQRSAIISALLAMLGILVYVAFRYEFSFAVAAVLATAHDALFTMAVFALVGGQLSSTIVAAVLTILGYSINDKIVILDRIREDLKLGVRGSFRELINLALNQTLSRTLITGGSVILATLSLYIFGGGVIEDFAFTFLVGILTGTYSSIFIASAIVLWWNKGHRPAFGPSPVPLQAPAPARG